MPEMRRKTVCSASKLSAEGSQSQWTQTQDAHRGNCHSVPSGRFAASARTAGQGHEWSGKQSREVGISGAVHSLTYMGEP